jgi:hypothetical protein
MWFKTSAEDAYLKQKDPLFNYKNLIWRKCFNQKLPQFSHGNNGLDAPSSITHGYLWRDKCVSPTVLSRPVCNK